MDNGFRRVTSRDGTSIAYERIGDGPPLILVMGAFNDRSNGAPLAAALSTQLTVYTYDRRGRGDSGDTLPYAVERELEDLDALIAEAGGTAFVYGMSSGAVLGLEAAARGLGVARLALYEPPVSTEHTGGMVAALSALISAGRRGDALEYFMANGPQLPAETIAQLRTTPMWAGMEAIAHTLVYDNTIVTDTTVLTRAHAIGVPTLVVGGAESIEFLRGAVRLVAEAVPGARHRFLDGQTHDVDPAVLAPALAEFFG
jgi:pimeloyl-ACP methyl ester carboxylesterase